MKLGALAAALLAAGCGAEPEPCAAIAGPCVALHVSSDEVERVDQLELDVVYGARHATTTTRPDGGGAVALPLVTAIALEGDVAAAATIEVGVVAAGKLGGEVLGTGAGTVTVTAGAPAELALVLTAPQACVAGGHYCGGDKVAGDPDTLYTCNGGGVPLARGVCAAGCVVRPTDDDVCRADGGPCVDGGFYCGGDKLDGDPRTLYRCEAGAGVAGVVCDDGCVVAPAGQDDFCR